MIWHNKLDVTYEMYLICAVVQILGCHKSLLAQSLRWQQCSRRELVELDWYKVCTCFSCNMWKIYIVGYYISVWHGIFSFDNFNFRHASRVWCHTGGSHTCSYSFHRVLNISIIVLCPHLFVNFLDVRNTLKREIRLMTSTLIHCNIF